MLMNKRLKIFKQKSIVYTKVRVKSQKRDFLNLDYT
jgi:hypothetical protein